VLRNRQLNALVCDLELPQTPADLAMQPWDRHEVHTLFDGLEFRVLRERLFETLESEEDVDAHGFDFEGEKLAPGTVAAWLQSLGAEPVGVHVRGSWGSGTGSV